MKRFLVLLSCLNVMICSGLVLGKGVKAYSDTILGYGGYVNISGDTSAWAPAASGLSQASEAIDLVRATITLKSDNGCYETATDDSTTQAYVEVQCPITSQTAYTATTDHLFMNWGEVKSGSSGDNDYNN